jgi:hypothetical protein
MGFITKHYDYFVNYKENISGVHDGYNMWIKYGQLSK